MKNTLVPAIILAASALASSHAFAGGRGGVNQFPEVNSEQSLSASKSRADVLAELDQAKRSGDIVANVGNQTKKLNELYPGQYPAKSAVRGKSRAQVLAELADAQRTDELLSKVGGGGRSEQ